MHRFFIQENLIVGKLVLADHELVHQLKDVLCLKSSERIIVCDGGGKEAEAIIEKVSPQQVVLSVISVSDNLVEPTQLVTLYCSILKRENFEWVVQKATEVGVRKIVPIITARTIKSNLNVVRLKKIIKEAAEQAGRGMIPEIEQASSWAHVLDKLPTGQINFFCHWGDNGAPVLKGEHKPIGVWVGPEGGWSDGEISSASEHGFLTMSLGSTVLRAETAAVVASWRAVNLVE